VSRGPQRTVLVAVVAESRRCCHVLLPSCCRRHRLDVASHPLVQKVQQQEEANKEPAEAAVAATALGH